MGKELSAEERNLAKEMLDRARAAMAKIEDWSQKDLDRLSQAIAWYAGNEKTFTRLAEQGVDESEIGDRSGRPAKRFKIHMVLRDVLRTPSGAYFNEGEGEYRSRDPRVGSKGTATSTTRFDRSYGGADANPRSTAANAGSC